MSSPQPTNRPLFITTGTACIGRISDRKKWRQIKLTWNRDGARRRAANGPQAGCREKDVKGADADVSLGRLADIDTAHKNATTPFVKVAVRCYAQFQPSVC